MLELDEVHIECWTADFGDGSEPEPVTVPHAWRQELPPNVEGPVVYSASIDVPKTPCKLRFEGVSYAAEVSVEGSPVASHCGTWDAFEAPIAQYAGSRVEITVSVVKSGGGTYPAEEAAGGFLPYVFHSFGGIHGAVSLVAQDDTLDLPAPEISRFAVSGSKIFVDGKSFYPRGLLHWGWYPELGHTNPPPDIIRREVREARSLGFNLVKFCLWVPPHRYLEILREEGMEAWLELPVWKPSADPAKHGRIAAEIERIARQYRRHDNILLWTLGCELGGAMPAAFRSRMTQLVKNLTDASLVADSSGGAEMFGGDLPEFGDFCDFHPYCDTQFFAPVLDQLLPGPRAIKPLVLGECNDADVHRDLAKLGNEIPFWASNLAELNERGLRPVYELPEVLQNNRFVLYPTKEHHRPLMESSRSQALFMRKTVQETVRARDAISGYALTGWRDTPISSSGFFDDWDTPRFSPQECEAWNGPACLYLIPCRRVPWVNGGNRPGLVDDLNRFTGIARWKVGIHSESPVRSGLVWRILGPEMQVVAQGAEEFASIESLRSTQVGEIQWAFERPGEYRLQVEFGRAKNEWPIWVVAPLNDKDTERWITADSEEALGVKLEGGRLLMTTDPRADWQPGVILLRHIGTIPKPFWREAAYEFKNTGFWRDVPFANQWARLLPIAPDRVIDAKWLESLGVPYETLLRRIDVRTYEEDSLIVRFGDTIITTLRPYGGLGIQPSGLQSNPAGMQFVRAVGRFLGG